MIKLRNVKIERNTSETQISLEINLDGTGQADIKVDNKFLTHMLSTLSKHSLIDIKIKASGDLEHHLVEDVGIALGISIKKALGDKRGIKRFGYAIVPMDESLAQVALDLGGRGYCIQKLNCQLDIVEDTSKIMFSLLQAFPTCINVISTKKKPWYDAEIIWSRLPRRVTLYSDEKLDKGYYYAEPMLEIVENKLYSKLIIKSSLDFSNIGKGS